VEPVAQQNANTVQASQAKMIRKISRVLAVTTIFYFFVGPLNNTVTVTMASFMPSLVVLQGSYSGYLNYTEGIMYTLCLLLIKQYRQELGKLLGKKAGENWYDRLMKVGLNERLYLETFSWYLFWFS